VVAVAARSAKGEDVRRKVPLLGVISALMLVAMSSEIIPIAYHINLTVLAAILLGPVLAPIAAFIVITILALLGHGGVTVIGLNTLVISAEMLVGWALFRAIVGLLGRNRVALGAVLATVLTLIVSTTLLVGIVWLGGSDAAGRETGALDPADLRFENPFAEGVFSVGLLDGGHGPEDEHAEDDDHDSARSLSVGRFAAVVFTLGPIGWILEALITGAIVGFISRVRPGLMFTGALADERRPIPGDETGTS
ncbi:MAG: energy-coupling factor ABC transporter permease, partial [Actinomycetota bacterium]|nr:energy-coupling factor ABC transporter permease [Actinomycetota bacterium]